MPICSSRLTFKISLCSIAFALSQAALAGGPDLAPTPTNPLNGFEMGIQGFVGAGITSNQIQFSGSNTPGGLAPVTTLSKNNNTVLTADGITGGGSSLGYNIPWGDTVAIEPLFSFNAFYGKINSQSILPVVNSNDSWTIQDKVTLKYQYNLLVKVKKLVSSNVALTFGLGASYLQFNNTLGAIPTSSATVTVPNLQNNGAHGIGPVIGLGAQWLLQHHSSLAVNFDNYFYVERNLGTITKLNPTNFNNFSNLTASKVTIFLPVISLQYNVNFCV